jgi:hypothetical protein
LTRQGDGESTILLYGSPFELLTPTVCGSAHLFLAAQGRLGVRGSHGRASQRADPDRQRIAFLSKNEGTVIQGSYKGIEIEMELHQLEHGGWRCDYTLIRHPEPTETIHHGDQGFPTMDLAREYALHDARVAIDQAS